MTLGADEVRVRLDEDGYLKRIQRTVQLDFGVDLYCAARTPKDTDKVMPYQPGYMKLVAAMGGQLTCPPTMRDPETGAARPNPIVETYPDTGIIRRVAATAVCVVPNPMTGELVASMQTIVVDTEQILRQALLNIDRDDCVKVVAQDDIDEMRAAGELRGWSVFPLAPPFAYIIANNAKKGVREALQTFMQQSATARQRACSKAERLAADHNPVTRMVWEYADLTREVDEQGNLLRAPYVRVPVVAWVEMRDRSAMRSMSEALAAQGKVAGIETVIEREIIDVSLEDSPERLLEETTDLSAATAPTRAREKVVATDAAPTPKPATAQPSAPESDPTRERLLKRIHRFELELGSELRDQVRSDVGIDDHATATTTELRAYQAALIERTA